MADNRAHMISTAVGGVVFSFMLITTAFAVGVYVGEHGWTREGLNYEAGELNNAKPGPAIAPSPSPVANPPGLPSGRPLLTGRILRISFSNLQIATPGGPKVVSISDETRYENDLGFPISLGELKKGDVIAVYGRFLPGGGGELVADTIVLLPPKEGL
jgi:hypothetical protein